MQYTFGTYTVDVDRREILHREEPVAVEPQVFDVLIYLIENRERVVTRDELFEEIWKRKFVSDSALSSRIRDLRAALGDDGRTQSVIKTLHGKGFRFVEIVAVTGSEPDPVEAAPAPPPLAQEVQYTRSFDGTRIAFTDMSAGDMPIVKTAHWMSHLEYDLESPIWRHWIGALCDMSRVIRYDERGNGMSERNVENITHEDCVRDLEHLIDKVHLPKVNLFGISQGASIAIDYAVRHPDRVNKIVIYGGFAKGWRYTDENSVRMREAMSLLMETGWGQPSQEFRQLFTSRFMPGATSEQAGWFNELQRKSVEPHMAAHLHNMFGSINVAKLLPRVCAPTLVLHARNDREIPIVCGQHIAAEIPGARFVSLDSENHIMLQDEPAFEQLTTTVERFLRE